LKKPPCENRSPTPKQNRAAGTSRHGSWIRRPPMMQTPLSSLRPSRKQPLNEAHAETGSVLAHLGIRPGQRSLRLRRVEPESADSLDNQTRLDLSEQQSRDSAREKRGSSRPVPSGSAGMTKRARWWPRCCSLISDSSDLEANLLKRVGIRRNDRILGHS
jgi:hypothetical protein